MAQDDAPAVANAADPSDFDALAEDASRASERTCIASRSKLHPDQMLRFVLAPDGLVTPDVARKLPGRGVWIDGYRHFVATAITRKLFAKAFRKQVLVAPELPEQIDALLLKRLHEALALANKAGDVRTGFGRVEDTIVQGRVAVLLSATDGAEDGSGKLARLYRAVCRDHEREPRISSLLTIDEMSLATGRLNVVHACLVDGNGARLFISAADRIERYRNEGPGARHGA